MATSQTCEVLQHLCRTVLLGDGAGLTDGQLLESFLSRRDEAAMAVLLRRHGPMVWGVCRRVLRNHHDAEGAFQATFLVLARKAASIASRELLANWLYGVAHRTALKARATFARRRGRERQVTEMPEPAAAEPGPWDGLRPLLDQALSRPPDPLRAALVLCDLEGKIRKEAAGQLGLPEGTVASRLARARAMLARRLARRGLALSGLALAAVLTREAASAAVPASLVSVTAESANLVAAAPSRAARAIPAEVVALTEGVLRAMLLTKLKWTAAVLLLIAVGVGAGMGVCRTQAVEPPAPDTPGRARLAQRDQERPAPDDVPPREPASVTVVLRVGEHLKYDHVQRLVKGLQAVLDVKGLDIEDAGPTQELTARIRCTRGKPGVPQAVGKAVEVLLSHGVERISIGDAAKADGGADATSPRSAGGLRSLQERVTAMEGKLDRLAELVGRLVDEKRSTPPRKDRP
jgi:RNA polymerase sigma factor (sigma-70 family)